MKKVGLVTLYNSDNYGALLQAYALQESIKRCNVDCFLVQHNRFGKKLKTGKKPLERLKDLLPYTKLIIKNPSMIKTFSKKNKNILLEQKKKNQSQCDNFRKIMFSNKSDFFYDSEDLVKNYPPEYDAYICGSDQIWNPSRFDGISPFFLDFGKEDVTRIAYAPSIGVATIPDKYHNSYSKWVNNFDFLSVREKNGCNAISIATGRMPECVLDPTFLLSKEDWENIAIIDENRKDKYILCYFLGKENFVSSIKTIKNLAQKLNAGIVILPPGRHVLSIGMTETNQICGPREFLGYIKDAEYVLTDSFHGTALSINFNKQFSVFQPRSNASFAGKFTRIDNILGICGLMNRKFSENDAATTDFIDYFEVNKKIKREIDFSNEFLRNAISHIKNVDYNREKNSLAPNEFCTGCSACLSRCNVGALSMQKDDLGFWHPVIDYKKCVNCGQCSNVCPVLNKVTIKNSNKEEYWAIYAKDIIVRNQGSSGNAFKLLADSFSDDNKVIYGATFDEDCYGVTHKGTDEVAFDKLQKSKYLESNMGYVISKISNNLKAGKKVFFCGTPCQVEGVHSALGNVEGLFLCDFICHGVPSSEWYKLYLKELEKKYNSKVVSVDFRSKLVGWIPHCIRVEFANGRIYTKTSVADPYLYDFSRNKHLRANCYNCNRVMNSVADVTIGDYWGVKRKKNIKNTNEGISVIRANTELGNKVVGKLTESEKVFSKKLNKADVNYTFVVRERYKPNKFDEITKVFPMKPKIEKKQLLKIMYYEYYVKLIKFHNRKDL